MDDISLVINKNKCIKLNYQIKDGESYRVSNKENIYTLSIIKDPQVVQGITSMVSDGSHVFFSDWDYCTREICELDCLNLSKVLTPVYLFKTREEKLEDGTLAGNYHAISLCKQSANDTITLLRTLNCDNSFKTLPLRTPFRSWVLRYTDKIGSNKPEFIKVIGNENLGREVSSAHLKVLRSLYSNLSYVKYRNFDGLEKLQTNVYETSK